MHRYLSTQVYFELVVPLTNYSAIVRCAFIPRTNEQEPVDFNKLLKYKLKTPQKMNYK